MNTTFPLVYSGKKLFSHCLQLVHATSKKNNNNMYGQVKYNHTKHVKTFSIQHLDQ